MEDLFDYGPDLLSDRASFQALVDELYSTDSNMQLDVEFSSRGTSPIGPATPPSSSGGQEEVASPDVEHEHQAFAQGALMTEMLAGMEGSTPNDLMRSGTNVYDALDTIDPSFHNPYLGVPSRNSSRNLCRRPLVQCCCRQRANRYTIAPERQVEEASHHHSPQQDFCLQSCIGGTLILRFLRSEHR